MSMVLLVAACSHEQAQSGCVWPTRAAGTIPRAASGGRGSWRRRCACKPAAGGRKRVLLEGLMGCTCAAPCGAGEHAGRCEPSRRRSHGAGSRWVWGRVDPRDESRVLCGAVAARSRALLGAKAAARRGTQARGPGHTVTQAQSPARRGPLFCRCAHDTVERARARACRSVPSRALWPRVVSPIYYADPSAARETGVVTAHRALSVLRKTVRLSPCPTTVHPDESLPGPASGDRTVSKLPPPPGSWIKDQSTPGD
eukprot:5023117-Prymnesium_polylepis.1